MEYPIKQILSRYDCKSVDDTIHALREILQQITLLGLWRSKFFEHAAFYGGSALHILYGLDRFSEDLDFSLIKPNSDFSLGKYNAALVNELTAFGVEAQVDVRKKEKTTAIESAFLKTNTRELLISVEIDQNLINQVHSDQKVKIRYEIDTDPPGGFTTESKYILNPIPFAVRAYSLPDLFAGKMHAVLCRKWKNRVKGRDWYDLTWYIANHPNLHLSHLEQRMIQSGHWSTDEDLTSDAFIYLLKEAIEKLDIQSAKNEVGRFISEPDRIEIWSKDFFFEIINRIIPE